MKVGCIHRFRKDVSHQLPPGVTGEDGVEKKVLYDQIIVSALGGAIPSALCLRETGLRCPFWNTYAREALPSSEITSLPLLPVVLK